MDYALRKMKENKHPRRMQRGILSLPRTRESNVLDSRFRGNDDASVGVLNPKENKFTSFEQALAQSHLT